MTIKIFWKNINIMDIIREEKTYITTINYSSFMKANEEGMPLGLFLNYNLVSLELPTFIKNRLPTPKIISEKINKNNLDDNKCIIDYINKTRCKCATDSFEIAIEE